MKPAQYKSLTKPGKEILLKEKGSKFYGYTFPVDSEETIELALQKVKSLHPKARHFCYAWQLGKAYDSYKVNDDGEPSNSAGMPIYGQLKSFEVTNCIVIIVRYFGGTKLGVGGLISAYKMAAKLSLEASAIKLFSIKKTLQVCCEYNMMNEVMRLAKEFDLNIIEQELKISCKFVLSINQNDFEGVKSRFEEVYGLKVKNISE